MAATHYDITILISGKFSIIVSELLEETLGIVQQWCDRTQISFNPQKMVVVPFTRKRGLKGLKEPTISGHKLQLATELKYLRFILDKGLLWKAQLENAVNKTLQGLLDL